MNRSTFVDATSGRKSALSNELPADEGDSDVDEDMAGRSRSNRVDGEEVMGRDVDRFDEAGQEIEAFNLQDEREDGYFDANGNYVFRKDQEEEDAWIATMNESEMEKNIGEAAEAKKKREALVSIQSASIARREQASLSELKHKILQYGDASETVSAAIRRLGDGVNGKANKPSKPPAFTKRERKPSVEVTATATATTTSSVANKEDELRSKQRLMELIELADQLLSSGLSSVYSMSFDAIRNSLYQWEYRAADGAVHGPYTCREIATWKQGGYFTGQYAVPMRPVIESRSRSSSPQRSSGNHDGSKKRSVTFESSINPPSKRAKVDTSTATTTADLLGDLDDDSDIEQEQQQKAAAATLHQAEMEQEQEQEEKEHQWKSSDSLDFGPVETEPAQLARGASSSSSSMTISSAGGGGDDGDSD
jgi:CD2 antigen cytoplasmic tail-binding protein 2